MNTLRRAERKAAKIKIGLFGPSGAGKTYSALKLASGMTAWDKIAVIDTENGSADLYSHLGEYNVLSLTAPFTPEKYIEAIRACEVAGMEVIIIDSISHEWEGSGGCLDIHSKMPGNSFANWAKVTPRHNAFIEKILQSTCHVVCCGRTKQDYVLNENGKGKQAPEKVGLKATTRDGFDYEMTLCFDLDISHSATSTKDRTSMFIDKPSFVITSETGKQILDWANSGAKVAVSSVSVAPPPVEAPKVSNKVELLAVVNKMRELCEQHDIDEEQCAWVTGLETYTGKTLAELEAGYQCLVEYIQEKEMPTDGMQKSLGEKAIPI